MKMVKPRTKRMKKCQPADTSKEMITLPTGETLSQDAAVRRGIDAITGKQSEKPLLGYNSDIIKNKGRWMHRLMIGTPTTGLVRIEWVLARFGQVIPTNWSHTDCMQFMHTFAPVAYLVADAQNLIVKACLEQGMEWLLLIEHDNVLPPGAFIKINEYMLRGDTPVVSGLYFTKSNPPEPMTYRGRGTGFYKDWKMGDKVWVDGLPTGFVLIHASILRELWKESPEYKINDQVVRRVFETPAKVWTDPETHSTHTETGTSDLEFCSRVMRDKIFEKAGWPEFQKKKFPFLVDTDIFMRHITSDGQMYPLTDPKTIGY